MRIFVTGATGFIGKAMVPELIAAGHNVVGLARSDAAAATLVASGARAHRGDLSDLDSLTAAAGACDGIVHLAYDHADLHASAVVDRVALEALTVPLRQTGKPIVAASVTGILAQGELGTEEDDPSPAGVGSFRTGSEDVMQAAARQGARAMIVRLPPSVHGPGDTAAFLPQMIALARVAGFSAFVGRAENRWPAVHLLDTVQLFRLALEQGKAGDRFHAVAESGVPLHAIAQVIGRKLDLPVRSIPQEQASSHFGSLAKFVCMDIPAASRITRERLRWNPKQPGFLRDLAKGGYFAPRAG